MLKSIFREIGKVFIYKKNVYIFFTISLILLATITIFTFSKASKLHKYREKLISCQKISISSLDSRKEIKDFIAQKTNFDKFFIDNKLESLTFLENEKSILSKLLLHPAFSNSEQIQKRLSFINSNQNKLKFVEEKVIKSTLITETDETQLKPIEIDENDLQKILSIVEDISFNDCEKITDAPQLICKNFSLTKKRENIFSLNMKILKREFYKKKNYE